MKNLIADFNSRVAELDKYYAFVEYVDQIETHKKERLVSTKKMEFVPDRETQKILRANCFVLLYNLVEATIRNSVLSIYDCIHDESLTFSQVSKNIQDVWFNYEHTKIFNSDKKSQERTMQLIEHILNEEVLELSEESIKTSGNMDYVAITKVINIYGFHGKLPKNRSIENNIDKVKRERNLLAHGNKSFCESGEVVLFSELVAIKDNVVSFLGAVLINVDTYLNCKQYRSQIKKENK